MSWLPAAFVAATLTMPAVPAPLFTFQAGFWNNLHHFLYVLGRAQNGTPDSRRDAVVKAPSDLDGLGTRPEAERRAWTEAVRFYAAGPSRQDLVFDNNAVSVTRAIADAPDGSDLSGLGLDPQLTETLLHAAPVYRAVWWPRHARANADRQRELTAELAAYGDAAVKRLTSLYGTSWPARPRVVNLAAYTNWAGAYSTDGGLIEFASTDPALGHDDGLETLLHESSHQWDEEIDGRLRRIADSRGLTLPRDLSHMLIFYTSGEIVRELIPAHVPYAVKNGVWDRGSFRGMKAVLEKYWQPYIDGRSSFDDAIVAVCRSKDP